MIQVGGCMFRTVWVVKFEFNAEKGELPNVNCLVAHELGSGQILRFSRDELVLLKQAPYAIDNESLFVSFFASAAFMCHLSLNWPLPKQVLDLFVEFRNHTNGMSLPCGTGLIGALLYFGLDFSTQNTAINLDFNSHNFRENKQLCIVHCEANVIAFRKLLHKMDEHFDMPRALSRGRSMKAIAQMEYHGIPIDVTKLMLLRKHWNALKEDLIKEIDSEFAVFDEGTFKVAKFAEWLHSNSIAWPTLSSGNLDLSDDAFRTMALIYPQVVSLRELRATLSQMRLSNLAVGVDGRNRCNLSPFRSRTGRNQPSTSQFIYGPAVWLRSLIKPRFGFGLAYIDWAQQEFGIAAALSNDDLMIKAYLSGDPYLEFAKQAGVVPANATKSSHNYEREQFKACVLAVQYGMGAESLAQRLNQPIAKAKELLELHKRTYKKFWQWIEAVLNYAMLHGRLNTAFGWQVHTGTSPNPRFLQNFPMQANGAEMLRIACCLIVEAGIKICAPVHDAILIEAPLSDLENAVTITQQLMADASDLVLNGFRLRTEVGIIRYPEHYNDERGEKMRIAIDKALLKHSSLEIQGGRR